MRRSTQSVGADVASCCRSGDRVTAGADRPPGTPRTALSCSGGASSQSYMAAEYYGSPTNVGANSRSRASRGPQPARPRRSPRFPGPSVLPRLVGQDALLTPRIAYRLSLGWPGRARSWLSRSQQRRGDAGAGRLARRRGLAGDVVMTLHPPAQDPPQHADRRSYTRASRSTTRDSMRMVKRCMDELEIDPKRFPPRSLMARSPCQDRRAPETCGRSRLVLRATGAETYALRRSASTRRRSWTSDLLVRAVTCSSCPDLREATRATSATVLVDEYQTRPVSTAAAAPRGQPETSSSRRRVAVRHASARPTSAHPRLRARLPELRRSSSSRTTLDGDHPRCRTA